MTTLQPIEEACFSTIFNDHVDIKRTRLTLERNFTYVDITDEISTICLETLQPRGTVLITTVPEDATTGMVDRINEKKLKISRKRAH